MNIKKVNQKVQKWIDKDDDTSALDLNGLTLPETIEENLTLNGLTSAMSLTLPTSVK